MSYQTISIKKIVEQIDHNKVFLPALQRKFVWNKKQIELLFDSLMRQYPIGAFLFWRLPKKQAGEYVFYEFLKEYDARRPYNRLKTGTFTHDEIIGVLDGQQRLSSMYIGLMGTHATKIRYRRHEDDTAYPAKALYINLFNLPYYVEGDTNKLVIDESKDFEFKFLTQNESENTTRSEAGKNIPVMWFKVGSALEWEQDYDADFIMEGLLESCGDNELQQETLKKEKRFVNKALQTLHSRVVDTALLSYFEVSKGDLEDVLKIFVRVNSGGTVLNKTDLLFSTIVATWPTGREDIEKLLVNINKKGDGFNFGNEFLMRCCLVLTDLPVHYKVNSFKTSNVKIIQNAWPRIDEALRKMVELLIELGFSGETLSSQNAVLPLAYHIFKGGNLDSDSKGDMKLYLMHSLIKRVFSNSQESLILALRNIQSKKRECGEYELHKKEFSFDMFANAILPSGKSLRVYPSELEQLLYVKKGRTSFHLLSLLSPHLRFHEKTFAQDHIHPYSKFNIKDMDEAGISREDQEQVMSLRDTLPNLQLLEGHWNSSKNATPVAKWIKQYPEQEQRSIMQAGFFPDDVDLEFSSFLEFHAKRRELLKQKLSKMLVMNEDDFLMSTDQENEEFIDMEGIAQ